MQRAGAAVNRPPTNRPILPTGCAAGRSAGRRSRRPIKILAAR